MVHFILGRNGYGKTNAVMRAISARAQAGVEGMLLLVPETVSHVTERALCAHAGNRISAHAEVTTFRRLCERVSAEVGRRTAELDAGGQILLMSRAMRQADSSLEILKGASRPEFLEELLSVEEECRASNVTPEQLYSAAEAMTPPLSQKLHDLSVIFSAYQGALRDTGLDDADRLVHLAEDSERLGYFSGREIWIDGFSGFSEVEYQVLRRIFRQAKDVTVTLCADPESNSPAFSKTNRVYAALRRICGTCRTEVLSTPYRFQNPALTHLERTALMQGSDPCDSTEGVEFFTAQSRYEECELAAAKVLELVRSHGYRYRDIGIAAREFSNYAETLDAVFSYYEIPVYLNHKTELLEKPVIALTCAALACIEDHFRYDDVLKLIKTGLTGLSRRGTDDLERYLYLWNIHGKDWSSDAPFSRSPNGMTAADDDEERLIHLNRLREKLRTPLMNLKAALSADRTGAGFARALLGYYKELHLPRRLRARAKLFSLRGQLQLADEYRQFWDILLAALTSIANTLGDTRFDLRELSRLFMLTVSRYQIASIPVSLDRVHAGGIDRMSEQSPRCLILLGCNDGEFPARVKDAGPLSDADRMRLDRQGITLARNTDRQTEEEFHLAYRALSLASERLILSCHEEETTPSYLYEQVRSLLPNSIANRVSDTVRASALAPALDAAMSGDASFAQEAKDYFLKTDAAPLIALSESRSNLRRGPIQSPELREAIFGHDLRLSASKIDTFETCRYQYFARYGLRLKPSQVAGLDAPSSGTLVHAVLENSLREITDRGGAAAVTREEARAIAERHAEEYSLRILGGPNRHTARFYGAFARLKRSVCLAVEELHDELLQSEFNPVDFELQFGPNGDLPAMEITLSDGGTLSLQGVVDRVDALPKDGYVYLRILDYKTGSKDFSIDEVINGIGMQMLLYLFALEEFGKERYHAEIRPAGVLYIPVRDITKQHSVRPSIEAAQSGADSLLKRKGLLVQDPALLKASKYLPFSYNKDGTLSSKSSVAPLETFYLLRDRMHDILRTIGQELHAGKVDANPYYSNRSRTSCDWCDYKAVCQFEPGVNGDKLRYLFTTKLDDLKGAEEHG